MQTLRGVVVEVESFVRDDGWDQRGRLFALVSTGDLVEAQPDLVAELDAGRAGDHLRALFTPVEQEIDVKTHALEELLEIIAWPPAVIGALAVVERVVLPPQAEADVPDDPEEAERFASEHADRQDVRIAAGVLRSGESHCVLRLRSRDSDDHVLQGSDLVPQLVEALRDTLEADAGDEDRSQPADARDDEGGVADE